MGSTLGHFRDFVRLNGGAQVAELFGVLSPITRVFSYLAVFGVSTNMSDSWDSARESSVAA